MSMRVLVVGAGAVGGYFGARLAQAGRDISFLVRPARAEILRRDGLRITGTLGDFSVQPKLVSHPGASGAPFDLIFVSVKAYALAQAIEDFAPALGPESMILPMLNGMAHLDVLAKRFGAHRVIGGECRVSVQLDSQGAIQQLADFQQIRYGELDGSVTARIRAVDELMQGVGFDAGVSEQIMQDMWEKWVQLAGLGASTCLLRGTIGDIVAVPRGAEITLGIINECAAIATACGYPPSPAFLAGNAAVMTKSGSPLASSMYRDLNAGSSVEVEQILGDLIGRAQSQGINAPLLEAATVALRIYQSRISRAGKLAPRLS
jgi:2-dehydropantoate 2-reductase